MAAHDLLGTIEASYALGIGTLDAATAKTGTLLATAITAVSEAIAQRCGTIVKGTLTGELHDGGSDHIWLDQSPVAAVLQVVEYDSTTAATLTAESNSSKPESAYWFDGSGRITRRAAGADARFPNGHDNVYVTYVVGRCESTATVPQRFKEAAAITLKNIWRTYEHQVGQIGEFDLPQASFPAFGIPNAAKHLLAKDWRAGSGTGD